MSIGISQMQKISELSEIYIRAGNGKYSEDVSQLQ